MSKINSKNRRVAIPAKMAKGSKGKAAKPVNTAPSGLLAAGLVSRNGEGQYTVTKAGKAAANKAGTRKERILYTVLKFGPCGMDTIMAKMPGKKVESEYQCVNSELTRGSK